EIALVAVECFADRKRAVRVIGAGLTACQRPRHVDCLPVGQDVLAVRGFKIVGQPDALDPVRTLAGAGRWRFRAWRRAASASPVSHEMSRIAESIRWTVMECYREN